MRRVSDLQTPQAVTGLEDAVRSDLAAVSALFVEGSALLTRLEGVLKVLPSSQARLRGWINQMDLIVAGIVEEQADISRRFLGGDQPPIEQHTNEAHLEVVRRARDEEAA